MQGKIKALIVLGLLVFVVPFFGIPFSARQWIIAILGLAIVFVSWRLGATAPKMKIEKETPVFVENGDSKDEPKDD